MELIKDFKGMWKGVLFCLIVAVPAWLLGKRFEVVGGPVFAILIGMVLALAVPARAGEPLQRGVKFTSKKILQYAVILLGFGLNLAQIAQVGATSLPIIVSTITTSLVVAFVLCRALKIPGKISTLIGVGSSICGGSAIAATAPVIDADDEEIAQAISVIFLFNVIAALVFPTLGGMLGLTNEGFGLFAGTAVNDTSSVTAAAAAFGSQAVIVAIDAKRVGEPGAPGADRWEVYLAGGRTPTGIDAVTWAQEAARRGAGEILLTSMDRDGTKEGFDLALTRAVARAVPIPVIASGGVGTLEHFAEGIIEGEADAVLAASVFHFGTYSIRQVKEYMASQGIPMRLDF